MTRFTDIVEKVWGYNPQADVAVLEKAYVFSAKAHRGQIRLSGEPYLVHPIEVAYILVKMHLDVAGIAAGLLHDTIEDCQVDEKELERYFGEEITELVKGVTKIGLISYRSGEDSKVESFRKMILAMSKDIRVLLIKLADRYHNMQTLNFLPSDRQVEIARETLDLYAPLAHRLGIDWIKGDLEDISFKYLYPKEYRMIAERINKKKKDREAYINEVKELIRKRLEEEGLQVEVEGRAKRFYSVYRKMVRDGVELDDIYDLTGFRVIVKTVKECYMALGYLHHFFKPIPGKFKDYIGLPKANMYQSLHTKVIGPYGEAIEIQIRTHEMHRVAEEGIAAHWKYKDPRTFDPKEERVFSWLRRVMELQQELTDSKEFLEMFKVDLFPEEIYVFTPKGDVKELPRGATALDFAYSIHTDLGHTCCGAKVNGRLVPLNHVLKSGDVVEIITSPNKRPSKDWLNFVVTSKAKTKIRQWIKTEQREKSVALGRSLLEKELSRHNLSFPKLLKSGELLNIGREFSFKTEEDLFASIGYGIYTPQQILARLLPDEEKQLKERKTFWPKTREAKIRIRDLDGIVVRFAKCCNPIPGDEVFGFITRGRGLTVHASFCPNVHAYDEQRKVNVTWEIDEKETYPVRLKVVADDRKGLLSDISTAISSQDVNILSVDMKSRPGNLATGTYEMEIKSLPQLEKVIKAIAKVRGVRSVERLRGRG
jgi:GTP pyrophosphokinase